MANLLKKVLKRFRARETTAEGGREVSASWYDEVYSSSASYAAPYSKSHYYFLWAVIGDRVRRQRIRRILDIGCGPGQMASLLLDMGVTDYVGIDFSSKAVELASKSVPGARFMVGDARESAIYGSHDYEAIICTEVLEHIEDDLSVVERFPAQKRCLCTVPSFPYESHVRNFDTIAQVRERYSRFFEEFDVVAFPSPNRVEDRFYLFEGIRNS